MDPFLTDTETAIARWFGIEAPNEPGRRLVAAAVVRRDGVMRGDDAATESAEEDG